MKLYFYTILVFFITLSISKASIHYEEFEEGPSTPLMMRQALQDLPPDDQQKAITEWIMEEVMPIKKLSTTKTIIMNGTECYISLARGAIYGVLGYTLAHSCFGMEEGLSVIYGGTAAIPMALLGSVSSRQFIDDTSMFLEGCFSDKRKFEKNIEKPFINKMTRLGVKLLFIGTPALISSSTVTNLAREEFSPMMGNWWWVIGAPNLFVRALMDYEKIPQVYERVRNTKYIKQFADKASSYVGFSNERRLLENRVKHSLMESKAYINSLDLATIQNLFSGIRADTKEENRENPLRPLFVGRKELTKETKEEKITGLTLATLSLAGLWVYYPLTVGAFEYLLSDFCKEEELSAYSNTLASIALSSASAIITVGGYETGKKCWGVLQTISNGCCNLTRKISNCFSSRAEELRKEERGALQPYITGTVSTILAGCTASTAYSIYDAWPIENKTVAMLVLTAAITSQFTLSAWAVDGALTKYLSSKNPKEPFLAKLDTIIKKLPDMSNEHLRALESILQNNSVTNSAI